MILQSGRNIPFDQCFQIQLASSIVCIIGVLMAQSILCLRTYALSGNNRLVGAVLILALIGVNICQIVTMPPSMKGVKFGQLPGIPLIGCFRVASSSTSPGITFSLILAVETLIFVITMSTGVMRQGFFKSPSRLAHILYRDSLIFYFYVFVMAFANVMVIYNVPKLRGLLMVPQHAVHCIAGTRVVLNVRDTAIGVRGITDELEALRLETFDAKSKTQHSMLDMPVDENESTIGRNSGDEKLGFKIQG
jgi:hypothetical protein